MPLTILVADDSASMRSILEMTFAGEDARVVTVGSGDQVVAKAHEVRPDIVLADASMPHDGYEVARAMKADAGLASIPVVLMASQQQPFDEAKGRSAGVDDHIVKPFDTQSVIDKLSRLAAAGATHAGGPRPAAAAPAAPRPPAPPAPPVPMTAPRAPMVASGGPAPASPAVSRSTVAFGSAPAPAAPAPGREPKLPSLNCEPESTTFVEKEIGPPAAEPNVSAFG